MMSSDSNNSPVVINQVLKKNRAAFSPDAVQSSLPVFCFGQLTLQLNMNIRGCKQLLKMLVLLNWEASDNLFLMWARRCGSRFGGKSVRLKCSKRRKTAIKGVCFFDSTNCQGFSRRGLEDCSTWSQIYADTGPSPAPFPKLSQVFYKPVVETKTHFWVQSRTAFRLRLPPQEPELGGTRETICAENADKLPPHVLCLLSLMRFFFLQSPKNNHQEILLQWDFCWKVPPSS